MRPYAPILDWRFGTTPVKVLERTAFLSFGFRDVLICIYAWLARVTLVHTRGDMALRLLFYKRSETPDFGSVIVVTCERALRRTLHFPYVF